MNICLWPPKICVGFISFCLPYSWTTTHKEGAFQKEIIKWCQAISPFHGYAGLGIIRNPNYAIARKAESYIFPFVQRFLGLEFDEPVDHAQLCRNGIKGINWLTIISHPLLEPLGGENVARDELIKKTITLYEYSHGFVIQASSVPQFGDTKQDFIPPSYQKVARVLKPLRAAYKDSLIKTPSNINEHTFAQQWLSRFDLIDYKRLDFNCMTCSKR
jgi:hypothetical protein